MKKFVYVLAAAMVFASLTGCGDKSNSSDATATETSDTANPGVITYGTTDFALYTTDDDLQPSKFLCMLGIDPSTIEYTDDNAKYMSQFLETDTMTVREGDKENPGETLETEQIRYVAYTGSRDAVINVKGITTTGLDIDDNDKCSSVDDVIKAYGIDTENEEYIENEETSTGSYTIRLNFSAAKDDGSVERIVTPAGGGLGSSNGKYSIRFVIRNDHVHGISYYMNY